MSDFIKDIRDSANELRHLKCLTIAAMLTALSIVIGFFQIPIGQMLYIRFDFIAIGMIGYLYGPVVSGLCACVSDLLRIVLVPTNNGSFFIGMTITAVLAGMVYGIAFYRRKLGLIRVLLTMLFIGVFLHILLNTYWLSIVYGTPFWTLLPQRIVKNAISIPVNTILFFALSNPLSIACRKLNLVSVPTKQQM